MHTVALAHMRETALRDHPIWSELQLDAGILELDNQPLEINGREFWLDVQYVADWKSLTYIMGFKRANTADPSDQICGWCHADKGFLRSGWRQTDIFARWEVIPHRHQGRHLPSLTLARFRYCAMHGCNRVLDNTLRLVQQLGRARDVISCMQSVCPRWGKSVATQCKHMKLFFQRQAHVHMALSVDTWCSALMVVVLKNLPLKSSGCFWMAVTAFTSSRTLSSPPTLIFRHSCWLETTRWRPMMHWKLSWRQQLTT